MRAPVDEIPQEQITGIRQITSDLEYFQEIIELAMNVSNYCYWRT